MQGVATNLDDLHAGRVRAHWQLLRDECGLSGEKFTLEPHFTWQIAEQYVSHDTQTILQEIAAQTPRFRVFTTGLGLFTGQFPVIYIPIIKNAALVALHQVLWERLSPFRQGTSDYYSPSLWTPHITLAYENASPEKMICGLSRLASLSFNWELNVDNFSFASHTGESGAQTQFRYSIEGGV